MSSQIYYFRINSDTNIGIGHTMRCVRLARVLNKNGHKCIFFQDKKNKFNILLKGFKVHYIYKNKQKYKNQKEDAKIFLDKIKTNNFTVIVDDYRFDHVWERSVKKDNIKVAVFDDGEKKTHYCDLYINYKPDLIDSKNFNFNLAENKKTKLLLGPRYAILDCNLKTKKKNIIKKFYNICFYMGGSGDFKFFDKIILEFIKRRNLINKKINIYIIIGPACKNVQSLILLSKKFSFIKIIDGKKKLDKIIFDMNLIIGSAGNIVYETSFYNIPSLFFEISENQRNDIASMEKIGHYFLLPSLELKNSKKLAELIYLMLKNYNKIYKLNLSKNIKVDNKGANRIAKNLMSLNSNGNNFISRDKIQRPKQNFLIRKIRDNEINEYLFLRNLPINKKVSISQKEIKRLDHYIWWLKSKRDSFVMIIDQKKIMYLYDETIKINSKNYSLQGWFAGQNKFGIKEVLTALNWHKKHISKKKDIDLSFGIIKKDNAINFSKYLGWIPIENHSNEFKILKKIIKINKNYNYYIRK